ncbi:hypothetical protein SAY86_028502 [Trapa natans]|uniref:PWWP domain-containing protein n=1 Tax=Trapa natans TaxID=22666 RepID=A0AAN7MIE4_TRANT|nr:hypothetical protein SAY86_028502 [Trapa natans]
MDENESGVNLLVGAEVSSSMEVDQGDQDGGAVLLEVGGDADDGGSDGDRSRAGSSGESGFGVVSAKEDGGCRSSEVKDENMGCGHFDDKECRSSAKDYSDSKLNDQYEIRMDEHEGKDATDDKENMSEPKSIVAEQKIQKTEQEEEASKFSATQYRTLMTEFDEYVANEKFGLAESGIARALSYGFEVGDLVWGKVKSHPWWPGHIFNDAFAYSSVRRTSRAGHVLVAFFGDSSYGWFDPAELIPFDTNFAEKSRQITSRNFVKAVEEAMDEIGRRRGLGMVCKCRNKYNFRPTNVPGYFAVDVSDYEQGAYSEVQIMKARDSFKPQATLDFIRKLALVPRDSDQTTLDFIKNRATVSAYRKAVFEEFDETYAQAFGTPVARPSFDAVIATNHPIKELARAPLSGPLVIAEALGGSRSSSKHITLKDQSKKDKYLFKRRDDSLPGSAGSLAPVAFMEGSSPVSSGDYVLHKRTPLVSPNSQTLEKQEQEFSNIKMTLGQDMVGKMATMDGTPYGSASTVQGTIGDSNRVSLHESRENIAMRPSIPGLSQSHVSGSFVNDSMTGVKQARVGSGGVVKKRKVIRQPPGEMGFDILIPKKKKRTCLGPGQQSDHQNGRLVTGKAVTLSSSREGPLIDLGREDDESCLKVDSPRPSMVNGVGNMGLDLRHLLNGLHHLAIDHFDGVEMTAPAVVRRSFLRFRSVVFRKSLVVPPASDSDAMENRSAKSSSVRAPKQSSIEVERISPHAKLVKPSLRLDDPSKGGRKRPPSDSQEELEAKKMKVPSKHKFLIAEKRPVQKIQDTRRGEGKEAAAAIPLSRSAKPGLARRVEPPPPPPPRAAEPTMLVMKFPPKTSLPSVAELKARFARFGPLDYDSIRVFWKSSTCRVVFQHKLDAQAACKYASMNTSLFGNGSLRCHTRPVDIPGPEETTSEVPRSKDLESERLAIPPAAYQPLPLQPSVPLRSCLKKPPCEDAGNPTRNGGKGTARVKFLLDGEENPPRQDQPVMMGSSSNVIIMGGSFGGDAAAASSSTSTVGGMNYYSKNVQQKSSLPPLLPLPPQFASIRQHNNSQRPPEIPLRNNLLPPLLPPPPTHINTLPPSPVQTAAGADISQQMISLLTRCNDVVTSLSGLLGYVPYRPL